MYLNNTKLKLTRKHTQIVTGCFFLLVLGLSWQARATEVRTEDDAVRAIFELSSESEGTKLNLGTDGRESAWNHAYEDRNQKLGQLLDRINFDKTTFGILVARMRTHSDVVGAAFTDEAFNETYDAASLVLELLSDLNSSLVTNLNKTESLLETNLSPSEVERINMSVVGEFFPFRTKPEMKGYPALVNMGTRFAPARNRIEEDNIYRNTCPGLEKAKIQFVEADFYFSSGELVAGYRMLDTIREHLRKATLGICY